MSPLSVTSTVVPFRPVGPMIVTKVSSTSLMIEWRPPLDDGGIPIIGYAVEMSEGAGVWRKVGYTPSRHTQFTIAGLGEGKVYFFRVFAENEQGLSRPLQSDSVVPTTPAGKNLLTYFSSAIASKGLSSYHLYRLWILQTLVRRFRCNFVSLN